MDKLLPRGVSFSHALMMTPLKSRCLLVSSSSSSANKSFRFRLLGTSCSNSEAGNMEKPSRTQSQDDKQYHKVDADDDDQMRECSGKEACEFVAQKRVSDHIIPHILNLYGARATPRDYEIYAPNASFEDPLMRAEGVKQIKSAFYSLSKVFSESKIVEYSVKETVMSPGRQEILIDNKQYYKFLGRGIDMVSLIKLYVEDEKVVRHEDWWDKKPIGNRENTKFPFVGLCKEMIRRGSMLATHAMMGFGKDPTE